MSTPNRFASFRCQRHITRALVLDELDCVVEAVPAQELRDVGDDLSLFGNGAWVNFTLYGLQTTSGTIGAVVGVYLTEFLRLGASVRSTFQSASPSLVTPSGDPVPTSGPTLLGASLDLGLFL